MRRILIRYWWPLAFCLAAAIVLISVPALADEWHISTRKPGAMKPIIVEFERMEQVLESCRKYMHGTLGCYIPGQVDTLYGISSPPVIMIRARLNPWVRAEVLAHEMHHHAGYDH
jgi:hypothetical protein